MPFYILLFLYLAPVCLALYWLTKLVVWIIKKVFQLVIWIVKTFFVLLSLCWAALCCLVLSSPVGRIGNHTVLDKTNSKTVPITTDTALRRGMD